MKHVRLGRTGLSVSQLCLGTMTFGYQCDEDTSVTILDTAFDAGVTFLDTADVYPLGGDGTTVGRTEEYIGRWMQASPGRRDRVVLASKFGGPMGPNRWNAGGSRQHIMGAIDASLRRLQTDYLDLYQIHFHDDSVPQDETLSALTDLVRSGKVRYIGCSNYLAWELARALGRSDVLRLARFDSLQPRYNLLYRPIERELLPLCRAEGVGVIPYNPLAGGFLSGKHQRDSTPTGRFALGTAALRYQDRYWHDRQFDTIDELRQVASECGVSLTTLALQWVLSNPVITAPIIGASSPAQLAEAIAAAGAGPLATDVKTRLDELTLDYVHHPQLR